MTTSEPSLAVEIAEAAKKDGVHSVDAPVSGGDVGAREARLSIMIGGDKEVVEALRPCWQAMGKTIVHQGGPGAGQHTKMVNQILIASDMIGVCEALLYGYKAGLDLETRAAVGRLRARREAGRSRTSARGSSPATSTPASSSSTSSRTWASPWTRRSGWDSRCRAWRWPTSLYLALAAQGHGRDGTHALELALAEHVRHRLEEALAPD